MSDGIAALPAWLRRAAIAVLALAVLAAGAWGLATRADPAPRTPSALALFTSLPIYWAEAEDIGAMLGSEQPPHWARTALEERWRLLPLDTLDGAPGLQGRSGLLMAQPRPLAPGENVALDRWVSAGGQLLLFADPALTAESRFALGDRRRPQDLVLLSPILARWGLELRFDDAQPLAWRFVALGGGRSLPVRLAGSFALVPGASTAACRLEAGGVIARCRIGRGTLVAVADAGLFEAPGAGENPQGRRAALAALTEQAFGP